MPGQTFTTYINAKRTGSVDQEFAAMGAAAQTGLGKVKKAADDANRAVAGLTSGRGTAGKSPIGQAYLNGFDQAKVKADRLAESQARLARENSALVRGLRTTGNTLQVVQGPLGPIAGRVTAAADALVRLTGVTLGLAGAGAALFAYVRAANQFVEIRSKLLPFTDTQEQANKALDDVYGIAQRARAGLAPVVDLYTKLTSAADALGLSQQRVSRLTELASKAATLSGGTSASREAGLYQFAQGIGSNQLGGDELRSVRENTLVLAQEIAKGLAKLPDFKGQADGSIASLKKLGSQGKLTADVIARAMDAAAGDIEARFAKLPPTLSSSFTSLGNSATMFVGRFEEATGIVGNLASGILLLGNNLNVVVGILGGVAAGWAAVAAGAKASDVSSNIRKNIDAFKEQQSAARSNLALAVDARNETAKQTAALNAQGNQIRQNIASLEAELTVQRELAASSAPGAKVGLPSAVNQNAAATQATGRLTKELADEVEHLSVVQTQAVTVGRKYEGQQKAIGVATQAVTKSSSLFKTVMGSLLGAINPVGIAVGLATAAFLAWATSESEAEKAAKKVEDAQRKLATVIDFTTGKVREQNDVLIANANLAAKQGIEAAGGAHDAARAAIADLRAQASGTIVTPEGQVVQGRQSPAQTAFLGALDRFQNGGSVQALQSFTQALAKQDPAMRSMADQVTKLAGDAQSAARQVMQLRASMKILSGTASEEDKRVAQGDFSGGHAQGETAGRNVGAEAEALRKKLADARYAASVQMKESLENLEKRRSQMDVDDYIREKAQIEHTYDAAIQSLDKQDQRAAEKAQREEERRERAHQAELKRIQEEDDRRQRRTETRNNILGSYTEEPKAVERARRDTQTLTDLIGKTQNGLAAITKDNPLGKGIYTKEMAAADAQNIEEGLQRPYNKFMESRQRDLNVSQLILQGRELEAQALTEAYGLYDQIGSITMDQYQSILQSYQVEQNINDALAQRQRLMAPLLQQVDNFRQSIAQALESLEAGQNPISVGKNFFKGLLASFNKGTAEELAAKITGGLDKRVRDLVNGQTQVDTQIAQYISALNKSGEAAGNVTTSMDKVKTAADSAAESLTNLAASAGAGPAGASGGGVGGGAAGALAAGGSSIMSAVASIVGGAGNIPGSFVKSGVTLGHNTAAIQTLFNSLGKLGGVITENIRPQSRQTAYYNAGITTARSGDHVNTQDAFDVRLPAGMSFQRADALVRKQAQAFGLEVVKALDETQAGGTGRHGHFVFGAADSPSQTAGPSHAQGFTGGVSSQIALQSIKTIADVSADIGAAPQEMLQTSQSLASIVATLPQVGGGSGRSAGGAVGRAIFGSGMEDTYNAIGKEVGAKLDKALGTKFMSGIGAKLGTALQGAQTGAMVAGIGKALWGKFSNTGAQIGGAIGSFLPFPGGDIVGAIIGGTIGGLMKKTPHASSTVTASGGIITAGPGKGSGQDHKEAATQLGQSVGDAVQQIADMLNATIGDFKVSIGVYKGRYIVDPTGAGRTHGNNTPSYATEEEAVQAALMDAIKDGAITGLSAASNYILQHAKNLQTALNKVQIIESIPKRLMALKDPVRAAVTDLNDEFAKMIAYLKEGGATAAQFAQAQELYDLERQKAIEQAAQQQTTVIQDMIDSMLNSQNSPLNRATVYGNAKNTLTGFATDIQAGKVVDADKFTKAAQDFQDASRGLYGSTTSFFDDFNYLLGLLNQAKTNVTGATATPTDLPPSPFAAADVQALIHGTQGTTDAVNVQTGVLGGHLATIVGLLTGHGVRGSGGTTRTPTAIDLLPTAPRTIMTQGGAGLGGGGYYRGSRLV